LEKIVFSLDEGQTVELYVLEKTKIGGTDYILVAEEQEGDCDAMILKEITDKNATEGVYEIVEDDTELAAVAAMFETLLEDVKLT